MRKFRFLVSVTYILALAVGFALASAVSISFTNGQNNYVQTTLIPQENTRKCTQFGLVYGSNCTTSAMGTSGCVSAPFSSVTKQNLVYRDCTIYTQDATGEAAYDSDQLYQRLVSQVSNDLAADIAATCAATKALSQAARDIECGHVGRPNGCNFCQ